MVEEIIYIRESIMNLKNNNELVRNVLIGLIVTVLMSIFTSIFSSFSNKIISWFTSYSLSFNHTIYQQIALSNDQLYQQQVLYILMSLSIAFFSIISIIIITVSFISRKHIKTEVLSEKNQLSLVALEKETLNLKKQTLILSNVNILLSSIVLFLVLTSLSYNLMVNRYVSESTNYFYYLLKVNADDLTDLEKNSYISKLTQIKHEEDYLRIVRSLEEKAFIKRKFIILNSVVRPQDTMILDHPGTKAIDKF